MKTIALVSVTLNAVNPMTQYLNEAGLDVNVVNYLDSFLQEQINRDGKITDNSIGRMFQMLNRACVDGADGIILTCTVFSPYVESFGRLLSVPVICPDGAMLDQVSKEEGRKAILCTFERTVSITRDLYYSCCDGNGTSKQVDMIVIPEAFEASATGDMQRYRQLILEQVQQLDEQYDHIVLAQISMADAVRGFTARHACIYTSPASACQAIVEKMAQIEKRCG